MTLDDLRRLVAKVDALSYATEEHLDNLGKPDRRSLERAAHLSGATAEAASAALAAADQLADQLAGERGPPRPCPPRFRALEQPEKPSAS